MFFVGIELTCREQQILREVTVIEGRHGRLLSGTGPDQEDRSTGFSQKLEHVSEKHSHDRNS